MEIVFDNILVYDGHPDHLGRKCDVGVEKDRISAIGDLSFVESKRRINCDGLSMIPGMIDVHTHSDLVFHKDPNRLMAIQQGITTEICSACGIGTIPLNQPLLQAYHKGVSAIIGDLPPGFDSSGLDCYFNSLPPTSVNVATQIGHSPLRFATTNGLYVPQLTKEMKREMLVLGEAALEQGCVGISTGLSYYPASLCGADELYLLGKLAAKYDVPFTFHQRDRNRLNSKYKTPVYEVIDVANHCKCQTVLSHYRTYYGNCGHANEICEPIEDALSKGLRVSADFYPYEIGCTYGVSLLPPESQCLGPEFIIEQLNDAELFGQLEIAIESRMISKQDAIVLHAPKHSEYLGLSYKQIAEIRGTTPSRVFLQLLREEELCLVHTSAPLPDRIIQEAMERDFAVLLNKPYYNIGSDTIPCCAFPHPRSSGTFIRIIEIANKYNIDLSVVANRTSYSAAQLYGLKDRGMIKQGYFADLIILDPKDICSRASYSAPLEKGRGIKYVMINGVLAMDNGHLMNTSSGKRLKRKV